MTAQHGLPLSAREGSSNEARCDRAVFQARESGSEPRYVTTFEIEEHARPTTAIVVDGHQTKTMVVQFEQRTSNQWRWQLGTYAASVYSLGDNSQWTGKTSLEFALPELKESPNARTHTAGAQPSPRNANEWCNETTVFRV